METYRRLGHPAMGSLRDLAHIAGGDAAVDKRRFIESALQEPSVALCRGNGRMLRAGRKVMARRVGARSARVPFGLKCRRRRLIVVPRRRIA